MALSRTVYGDRINKHSSPAHEVIPSLEDGNGTRQACQMFLNAVYVM
ncbi:MAG: hypothetical protein ACOCU6_00390 [Nanoarchaeota archaeon]